MNREEIIRMARDAGSIDSDEVIETVFAAFAAAEREACARVCESAGPDAGPVYCAFAIRARK